MKKSIKSFILLLITIFMCFSTSTSTFAETTIPNATSDFYVNDFAKLFTEDEKNRLMNNAITLSNEHNGIQVVISTVMSLDGNTIEDYANKMYNKYRIGKDDMGLLILISTGDRKIRIEVGKSMETYINDSKAGRFIREKAKPYLQEDKFNEGLIILQEALISEIISCIKSETDPIATENSKSNTTTESNIDFFSVIAVLATILLFALIIFTVYIIIKKIKKRRNLILNLNKQISELETKNNMLISSHANEISNLNHTITLLRHDKETINSSLNEEKKKLQVLNDRYQRVLKIYHDADAKVDAMIEAEIIAKDKQVASNVDTLITSVIDLSPNKDLVNKFEYVTSRYSNLNTNQKKYIKSDIKKLNLLYDESLKLKKDYEKRLEEERIRKETERRKKEASDVNDKILAIISLISIAKARDLSDLENAKDLYDNLDYQTKKYVDKSTISKLNDLLDDAKKDKEEAEEERRRAYSTYHSSNSFDSDFSSSSFDGGFSGFGGDSGGGGASADF